MKGRLIVFEGTDGAGKTTQVEHLCQHLTSENQAFRKITFPRYGNPFAEPARLYLAGALGSKPGDVNAYAASILYAVDRYASYQEDWGADYESGGLIIADRYTTSNAVHQASKLPEGEREEYLAWLHDLEYYRLGLPKPDLVLYLDLPIELSERLLRWREAETGAKADIHERDSSYLRRCYGNARELARALNWRIITCAAGQGLRRAEEIHAEVWELVRPIL